MKEIKIESDKKEKIKYDIKIIFNKCLFIIMIINLILTIYLIIQNAKSNKLNGELSNKLYLNEIDSIVDRDMVGMSYPEIPFRNLKSNYVNGKIVSSFLELLKYLETKLIYFEKEINATKLISFFTARKLYLKEHNVSYDDSKIIEYHDIINDLIIHESTQLKGIASDKYLACKYVEIKLGINLCPHRIDVYDKVEEIDFEKIINMENVILKFSNGNDDNVFITDETTLKDIEKIKKK